MGEMKRDDASATFLRERNLTEPLSVRAFPERVVVDLDDTDRDFLVFERSGTARIQLGIERAVFSFEEMRQLAELFATAVKVFGSND